MIRRCGKISLSVWLYTYKNGERRDTGRHTKEARVMKNEYLPTCGSMNRGFYMKSIFKKIFCFKCMSIYCQNGKKLITTVRIDILQLNVVKNINI
jgi:hypothetical protein